MARMKTLYIEMNDPANALHESDDLDHIRKQAWNDAIAGMYVPDTYDGLERIAYDLGRTQIEEFCVEEGIDLFEDLEQTVEAQTLTPLVDEFDEEDTITVSNEEWDKLFQDLG